MQRRLYCFIVLAACWGLSACGGSGPGESLQFAGTTMGTAYSVKVARMPATIDPDALQTAIAGILEDVNAKMSTYDNHSELSRLNQQTTTDWVAISTDLAVVMEEALRVSRLTDGAFDVTVGPLVNLWGFGPETREGEDDLPQDNDVTEALVQVGYEHVHVRNMPPAVRKDRADIYVDLSAIAKGYGVDKIAEHLESQEIVHYLVDIGGDLRAKGRNPKGKPWTIGIEAPTADRRTVKRLIQITEQAVATSGDYRNFFERDAQRYSHAIDPRTGRPVTHQLASVTVIDTMAMRADAMATALLVMGLEAGYALAERQKLAAFFIAVGDDGFIEQGTSEFDQYLLP